MKDETREHARVTWIPSFVAFYNTPSLAAAGKAVGSSAKTVRDNVRSLEQWLHRPLMDEGTKVPTPTIDAEVFFPDALVILGLLNLDEMSLAAKHARVTINGVYLEEGTPSKISAALEVGKLLARFRADPTNALPPPPPKERISGSSIDMSWYTPSE